MQNKFATEVEEKGALPAMSFPGGYPIIYFTQGDAVLCSDCATKRANEVEEHRAHMEGAPIDCDDCSTPIESAYGDPDDE